jgi:hypothetical protein
MIIELALIVSLITLLINIVMDVNPVKKSIMNLYKFIKLYVPNVYFVTIYLKTNVTYVVYLADIVKNIIVIKIQFA